MSNTVRVIIEAILVIALVVAIILFFNQSNALSETEDTLASVQDAGTSVVATAAEISTQQANDLNEASVNATESAAQASTALSRANYTATQSAEIAATTLSQTSNDATQDAIEAENEFDDLAATSTQSYEGFTVEIGALISTATHNADILTNLENSATQFADESFSTATQFAVYRSTTAAQSTDFVATNEAISSQLATRVNAAATLQAERDLAQEAINIQATALAEEATVEASNPAGFNLVLFKFKNIEISVPETYLVIDPKNDIDDNLDTLNDLGDTYTVVTQLYKDNAEANLLFAVPEQSGEDIVFEAILLELDTVDLSFDVDLDDYLNGLLDLIGEDVDLIESAVITFDGQDVGLQITSVDIDVLVIVRVRYVFKAGNDFYELNFLTTDQLYEDSKALFEAIAATFEVIE